MSDNEEIWSGGFRKNSKDEVRVSLSLYKGVPLLGLRVWFKAEDGSQRPGKDGFSVKIEQLPALRQLIEQAEAHAVKRGILSPDSQVRNDMTDPSTGLSTLISDLTPGEGGSV